LAKLPPERRTTLGQLLGKMMPQGRTESLAFIALSVTAGVCEEFIYRGFALTVLERAAGGYVLVGVIASSVLFSLAHLYQGRRGAAVTFVLGGIFAVSRVLTGSLLPAIAAHTAVDLLAGLLGARLLGPREPIREQPTESNSK
jgi:membrane protease YdiL (CAAX protease family)